MKILVIGANGFIGSNLCNLLLKKNQDISAMIRKNSSTELMKKLNPEFDKLNIVYGDLKKIDTLIPLVKDKDVVINVAGIVKGLKQKNYDDINVAGSVNLCEA